MIKPLKLITKKEKRGQISSALFIIISLVVIGIIFLFMNTLSSAIFVELDEFLNDSADLNSSQARETLNDIQEVDNVVWDWAFLAIFIGYIIQVVILSFATRINVVFFWLFVVFNTIILFVGVILSNIWQEMASSSQFADTIVRYPITNALLGTFFPMTTLIILTIIMVILFGKPQDRLQ